MTRRPLRRATAALLLSGAWSVAACSSATQIGLPGPSAESEVDAETTDPEASRDATTAPDDGTDEPTWVNAAYLTCAWDSVEAGAKVAITCDVGTHDGVTIPSGTLLSWTATDANGKAVADVALTPLNAGATKFQAVLPASLAAAVVFVMAEQNVVASATPLLPALPSLAAESALAACLATASEQSLAQCFETAAITVADHTGSDRTVTDQVTAPAPALVKRVLLAGSKWAASAVDVTPAVDEAFRPNWPFADADQIRIQFSSKPSDIPALTLTSLGGTVQTTLTDFDDGSLTATYTLPAAILDDKLHLTIGAFEARINVFRGNTARADVSNNDALVAMDVLQIINFVNAGTGYDRTLDVNGDGAVNNADSQYVLDRINAGVVSMPAGEAP
jgi:hypothetical protein